MEQSEDIIRITAAAVLEHWQGHRRLTRRLIEAFPEKELFTYSVGGMRPFSAMVMEFIGLARAGIRGVATGTWPKPYEPDPDTRFPQPATKGELLQVWDEVTDLINSSWKQIPSGRFLETDLAFGQWKGEIFGLMQYWIDNEIHHRGQAYVYLRALGIEPPAFWNRQ